MYWYGVWLVVVYSVYQYIVYHCIIYFVSLYFSCSALVWCVIGSNDDAALSHPPYLHAMSLDLDQLGLHQFIVVISLEVKIPEPWQSTSKSFFLEYFALSAFLHFPRIPVQKFPEVLKFNVRKWLCLLCPGLQEPTVIFSLSQCAWTFNHHIIIKFIFLILKISHDF